ncbi:enoyl-CoA hydratase/isomerase family protein [Actinomadura fibrosa]|uniref:Enoyl-CoA hydratase/isomerase family protein n=1 Tax=Actinomadura fibrosa TaxID=111802 RepID=A0ABW2XLD3_9ACTN|nr:enoyl-CoA hydratase/isomerase family protein [Actinomadura fibrosa]
MTGPVHVSIADLAAGAAGAPLLGPDGAVRDPLVFVDLAGMPGDAAIVADAVRQARESDRILIGTARGGQPPLELVQALDLTLGTSEAGRETVDVADPEERVRALHDAVTSHPQAALMLRDVLRTTGELPVPAALDVESYAYSTLLGGEEFRRWLAARGPRPGPPETTEPVLVARDGGRLRITLNRPERRNAYGRQVRDALVDALEVALLDGGIGRVTLDGAGPAFCSGGDLGEFGTAPDLATAHLVRTRGGAGRLVHRLGSRLEVRVHGTCVGAGVELPALAARVTARPDATFRLPEVSMGLIPGAGGTVGVPRRIGRWRALYLALTGEALDAETAHAWGLVDGLTGP